MSCKLLLKTKGRNNQNAVYRAGLTKIRKGIVKHMSRAVFKKRGNIKYCIWLRAGYSLWVKASVLQSNKETINELNRRLK